MANSTVIEDYFQPTDDGSRAKRRRLKATTDTSSENTQQEQTEPNQSTSEEQQQDSRRNLRHAYTSVCLGGLKHGPQRIKFTARIVNIYDMKNTYSNTSSNGGGRRVRVSKNSGTIRTSTTSGNRARGCLKLLAKDNNGCILINLWYGDKGYEDVLLGELVSVWTTHVSAPKAGLKKSASGNVPSGTSGTAAGSPAVLTTSIFPERDRGCYLLVHEGVNNTRTECRIPLGYSEAGVRSWGLEPLCGVLERKAVPNGRDVSETKVLVYVKAVGGIKRYVNSQGTPVEKVDVGLADESGEVVLTLFGRMLQSAILTWVPHSTILLIMNASWRLALRKVNINSRTTVEVNPDIVEAEWLRTFAKNAAVLVNPVWPEDAFDVEAYETSATRIKFTLKDIDEFVRSAPREIFMGYVSVIITEVNLAPLYKEGRLFCAECCNMPIFANAVVEICGQCGKENELGINPQIIGSLADETGTISISSSLRRFPSAPPTPRNGASKQHISSQQKRSRGGSSPLLWSPSAWRDLLGCDPVDLLNGGRSNDLNNEANVGVLSALQALTARLLFLRVTICFGWSPEKGGGRLGVCKVLE